MITFGPGRPGWRRHFEGWQLGVVAVGIAAAAAILIAPWAAPPTYLPVPDVDRREQAHVADRDRQLAKIAADAGLPFAVRVVGERFRRFGAASVGGSTGRTHLELRELRTAFVAAQARHGDGPLLQLRAVEAESFLAALRRWEDTGDASPELTELGGDFVRVAAANCWLGGRRLALSEAERRTLFRARWAELVGALDRPPFALTLNEWRTYFRFLLDHPERGRSVTGTGRAAADEERRLGYVEALGRRDPSYPRLFARGVLFARLGRPQAAADSFDAFLQQSEPSVLRPWARNHLAWALAAAGQGSGE